MKSARKVLKPVRAVSRFFLRQRVMENQRKNARKTWLHPEFVSAIQFAKATNTKEAIEDAIGIGQQYRKAILDTKRIATREKDREMEIVLGERLELIRNMLEDLQKMKQATGSEK